MNKNVSIKKSINTVILFGLEEGLTEMNGMQTMKVSKLYPSSACTITRWGDVSDKI